MMALPDTWIQKSTLARKATTLYNMVQSHAQMMHIASYSRDEIEENLLILLSEQYKLTTDQESKEVIGKMMLSVAMGGNHGNA